MRERPSYHRIVFALAYGMGAPKLKDLLDRKSVSLVQVEKELAAFNLYMKAHPFKGARNEHTESSH